MQDILGAIGEALAGLLPLWVRLPNLTFTLPHWAYWAGLLLFPIIAMYLIRRAEQARSGEVISKPIAYMLWLWGGFAGLHRFYLGSHIVGFVYVLLFTLVLYGNSLGTKARDAKSATENQLKIAEFMVKRAEKSAARQKSAGAEAKLAAAQKARDAALLKDKAAFQDQEKWQALVGGLFWLIMLMMIADAFLIPGLVSAARRREAARAPPREVEVMARGVAEDERSQITSPLIERVGMVSDWSGNFVAYWSVIAVFVYYYEVVARYVFNSPTNWAHESMFLMFGMQYLLSGAYALKEESHVRVDVIYGLFSPRARAWIDVVTSLFFFIFTITLMLTGFLFAFDSMDVWEVSFTEWAIQYWPVKLTIGIGALLLLLQGIARLIRDVTYLRSNAVG